MELTEAMQTALTVFSIVLGLLTTGLWFFAYSRCPSMKALFFLGTVSILQTLSPFLINIAMPWFTHLNPSMSPWDWFRAHMINSILLGLMYVGGIGWLVTTLVRTTKPPAQTP